jgi:D-alanyl-D-alanine carboxypeptidase
MRKLLPGVVFVLIAVVSMAALAGDTPRRHHENTQQFYQDLLDSTGFLGAALTIDGAGEYFNGTTGYANLQTGQPWQPDIPFYAGSIGKTFIAVVVLQLWDEGLLDLDDPLTRWLEPQITDNLVDIEKVTLRHLLNHTSGIIDVLDDLPDLKEALEAEPGRVWSDAEVVSYAYGHPLFFEPGSQLRYSNTGYMLLAMVIQRVTGEHASVAVRQRILDPLDLTHTYYQVYEGDGSALVHGYVFADGEQIDTHPWVSNFAFGAAAIATTTSDLGRFYRAIFKDRRLLSKKARQEMLEKNLVPADPFGIERVGLGIVKTDWGNITSYWHNGAAGGYLSIVRYFPYHDLVVAGFVNFSVDDNPIQPAELFNQRVLSVVMGRLSVQKRPHHHR